MGSGGAALPPETQRLWERIGVRVAQGYGASECSPIVTSGRADGSTPIGTCGTALRGVEVRLSPEGEMLVRGPNVMRGYWQDPERTAEVLVDGWYHTGDLGSLDAAGNLSVAGRAKDLLVLPSGHEGLADRRGGRAARPPGREGRGGADGASRRRRRDAARLSDRRAPSRRRLNAIIAACNGRLAVHQRVATASWWEQPDFPRTSTLKLRRNLLPAPTAAATVKVDSRAADDPVGQAIAGVAKVVGVQPAQTLGELGLDSLGLVDLALALEEKTGKAVGDGDLRLDMTLADIRAVLQHGGADSNRPARALSGSEPPRGPTAGAAVFERWGSHLSLSIATASRGQSSWAVSTEHPRSTGNRRRHAPQLRGHSPGQARPCSHRRGAARTAAGDRD